MTEFSAELAPDLANDLAGEASRVDTVRQLPTVPRPPDTTVVLPCGYFDPLADKLYKDAEVRELNGDDEEALARVADKNPRKFFNTMLQRGVIRVGDSRETHKILPGLTVGDIDALLLGIRYATYGDDIDLDLTCPHCQADSNITLNLPKAIPVKTVDDPGDMDFTVALKGGHRALVSLVTYEVQSDILDGKDKTVAEMNTVILANCITSLDGESVTVDTIRRMGMKDRQTIIKAIASHTPGPQLSEVEQPCPECGEQIPMPLSMADLFLLS